MSNRDENEEDAAMMSSMVVSEQDSILSDEDEQAKKSSTKKKKVVQKSPRKSPKSDQSMEDIENMEENLKSIQRASSILPSDKNEKSDKQSEKSTVKKSSKTRRAKSVGKDGIEKKSRGSQSHHSTQKIETQSSATSEWGVGKKKKKKRKKKKVATGEGEDKKDRKKSKKKDKKDRKKKDKDKSAKKTSQDDKTAATKAEDNLSDLSSNVSSDSSEAYSVGDKGFDYGKADKLSDTSSMWDDRSQELYDSDNPDEMLNTYHVQSKARLLVLEDVNEQGEPVQLELDYMDAQQANSKKKSHELKGLSLSYHDMKKLENQNAQVDHFTYQEHKVHGKIDPLILNNTLSEGYCRGVIHLLACPICQEILSTPVIYKNCLHRFCSVCIETYNRQGKKECPLCRIAIGNRRQLRPDKNISALMSHLTDEIKKIQKLQEVEHADVRRKVIQEQKKLKEKKDKQKRFVQNEFRRKYAETQQEKIERCAKEREEAGLAAKSGSKRSVGFGGEGGAVDTNHVIRLIEEKKANIDNLLLAPDIEIVIKLDPEQARQQSLMISMVRLRANKHISLIHLSILMAHKNALREDEWPNFEFFPDLQTLTVSEQVLAKLCIAGQLRPFRFKSSIHDILSILYQDKLSEPVDQQTPIDKLELIYKKKPLPQITHTKHFANPLFKQENASALNNIAHHQLANGSAGHFQNVMGANGGNQSHPGNFANAYNQPMSSIPENGQNGQIDQNQDYNMVKTE